MAGRSPARFLAPIALVAFGIALYAVMNSSLRSEDDGSPSTIERQATSTPDGDGEGRRQARRTRRRYTVRPGDTPSSIAEKTGVPLEELERLNPDLDPQLLSPGQRLKLRQ